MMNYFINWLTINNIVPLSVIIAIFLFIFREAIDFIKKRQEKKRKLKALKQIMQYEIEQNHSHSCDAVNRFYYGLNNLIRDNENIILSISVTPDGQRFIYQGDNDKYVLSLLPSVHRARYDKHLLDLVSIDNTLCNLALEYGKTLDSLETTIVLMHREAANLNTDLLDYNIKMHEQYMKWIYKSFNDFYSYCSNGDHLMEYTPTCHH